MNETQLQRNISRTWNVEIITSLKFRRIGNSNLFFKENIFLFSPGISQGKHGNYWFDIRKNNIDKVADIKSCYVLLRIYPLYFMFIPFVEISRFITSEYCDERAHSGKVWGFYCDINEKSNTAKIVCKNDDSAYIVAELLDKTTVSEHLKEIEQKLRNHGG